MTAVNSDQLSEKPPAVAEADERYIIDERELVRPADRVTERLREVLGSTGISASDLPRDLDGDRRPG